MLTSLRIRDLAIVDDLTVEFGPGLNVLSGETGAGKSIVVGALGLVAGRRADAGVVRAGAGRAVVEAVFEPTSGPTIEATLAARGLDADAADGGLVVRREVASGGAGRVFVNGSPATLAVLRELSARLLEIHGQHDQQALLSAEQQLGLLDRFGGNERRREAVREGHRAVVEARERLERLRERAEGARRRRDELSQQIREIDVVEPRPGERDEIDAERRRLKHGAEIARLLDEVVGLVYEGEGSASARAAAAARGAARLTELDPALGALGERLSQAQIELEDVGGGLRDYREETDFDPSRLEDLESRRAALDRLCLLYGADEAAVLAYREDAAGELAGLERLDEALAEAGAELAKLERDYRVAARSLSDARERAASRIATTLAPQLGALALEGARFEVALSPCAQGPLGVERAEFLLSANPGEPSRPLGKIASGGELSRVMLALNVALGRRAAGRVLVFDEVDAGIGGRTADAVGSRLARLAADHQVLCVTHLPQVAAYASRHYTVRKETADGRTRTEVLPLARTGRLDELARMLGGREAGAGSRRNAEELLAAAGRAAAPRRRA